MTIFFVFISILAIVSIILFIYFRNRQADRNDCIRVRFETAMKELMERLNKNNLTTKI